MRRQIRNTQDLGSTIRELRRDKNLTQDELAKRAGVSQKWISHVESGKTRLGLVNLLALLDALDIELILRSRDASQLDLDELLGLPNE